MRDCCGLELTLLLPFGESVLVGVVGGFACHGGILGRATLGGACLGFGVSAISSVKLGLDLH